jgi:hypothetical protein
LKRNNNNLNSDEFPPRTERDSLANTNDFNTVDDLIFFIKAFTNYPMPKIKIGERIFLIDYENPHDHVTIDIKNKQFILLGHWQK